MRVPRQAVILAGGEGTRLRPITFEISKQLIPVQGKPIMTWLVRWLHRAGVERVLVIARAQWATAYERWSRENDLPIVIDVWVEQEPMGTLGAMVHAVRDQIGDESVIVTNGDELKGLSLETLAHRHDALLQDNPLHGATIALIEVPNPSDYGVAELDGHRIARFHEKPASPPSHLVSSGLYIIEPRSLDEVDHSRAFLMIEKDYFPHLAATGRLGGCPLSGAWFDCGTIERWEKAIREWKE